jgi:predicted GTPase
MQKEEHFTDKVADVIQKDDSLDDAAKAQVMRNLAKMRDTKLNILITGATGCGKSSTINALFGKHTAKVGQGVDPETMDISKFELSNVVLYDSPGLGDGKEADLRHAENIVDKLYEKDNNGNMLIDLVLVILEGASRDLGTSFQLINEVIIPNLGKDQKRLLVAINQADVAMKGRYWNDEKNYPEPPLVKFLEEKVESTRRRIKEATGVDVEPIYYSAGYKDGDQAQNPYNLSKLMYLIIQHTKTEKRAVIVQDMNKDSKMWEDDDRLMDYRKGILDTLTESITNGVSTGADIGSDILGGVGSLVLGDVGDRIGSAVGKVVGGAVGAVAGAVSSVVKGIFGGWW